MSIQKKKQKKNGKLVTYYYPVIYAKRYTGVDKHIWGKGFLHESDAKNAEIDMINELINNQNKSQLLQKKKKVLFKEVKTQWLNTRVSKELPTMERDISYCNLYLAVLDDFDIRKIDGETVQKWTTLLASKYAPKTTNLAFNILSQIIDYAIKPLGILNNNPCNENIQRPKNRKKGVENNKYWTEAELKLFITHPYTMADSYYNMYLIHSSFGFRPGEICGLSTWDINFDTGILTLNHGLDKKRRLTNLKNTGAQRSLHIPKQLFQTFKKQIEYSNSLRSKNDEYPYLFVSNSGSPISPDTYHQHLERLLKRINKEKTILKPITPYGFRHTWATLSLLKGEYIKVVADVLGDTPETVMANYAHSTKDLTVNSLNSMVSLILDDTKSKNE